MIKKNADIRTTNAMVLNCLRGMIKDAGFTFSSKKKERSETLNGKSYKRAHFFYFII